MFLKTGMRKFIHLKGQESCRARGFLTISRLICLTIQQDTLTSPLHLDLHLEIVVLKLAPVLQTANLGKLPSSYI